LREQDPVALDLFLGAVHLLPTVEDRKLRENRVPMLALVGTEDPVAPQVDRLRPLLSGLQVTKVPGGGHLASLTDPRFLAAATRFLDRQP
ncbi:MAG TPA: alpha/beta hydrolase, partial [Armatimonadota bacterium]|nr:alpha/beta hydrolase [Armatimonadota bacterium]